MLRISLSAASSPGVVGGEDATDQRDDGDAVLSVVAQCIDIPPLIGIVGQRLIETRSAVTLAAASRPDSAAIGTPGPGCVLPPAR